MKKTIILISSIIILSLLNSCSSIYERKERSFINNTYNKVDISLVSFSCDIVKSEDDTTKVTYFESDITKFKIIIDNDTLSIVEKRYNIFDKGAIENIKVFIPKSFAIDNFNINSSSGSITMNIENEINNLKIKQTSGGAYLNNLKINDLNIENNSGNVSLNNIETNSISINTTSSSILLKEVKANSLLIKGVSSAVKTTKSIIHNNIDIETYSGNIELYLNENIEGFKLKASSNSTIKNEFNDFNYKNESLDINLKSISGLINVLKEV